MEETMNSAEMMRVAVDEEIRRTEEQMMEGGPDSTRQILNMYRALLESEGVDVRTLTGKELIEKMAFRNAEKGMQN